MHRLYNLNVCLRNQYCIHISLSQPPVAICTFGLTELHGSYNVVTKIEICLVWYKELLVLYECDILTSSYHIWNSEFLVSYFVISHTLHPKPLQYFTILYYLVLCVLGP
ncbi:hypothetical protein OTU49_004414 [Cherax quadricarinatus]|uniref:Uncharacterized protein n=1 Tax=Cherax quadricarinatus TaxID=27406 RepID=A0AAW0WYU0_CHEQU